MWLVCSAVVSALRVPPTICLTWPLCRSIQGRKRVILLGCWMRKNELSRGRGVEGCMAENFREVFLLSGLRSRFWSVVEHKVFKSTLACGLSSWH